MSIEDDFNEIMSQCASAEAVAAFNRVYTQFAKHRSALAFAASVIKSGEPWTPTCEAEIGSLLQAAPA